MLRPVPVGLKNCYWMEEETGNTPREAQPAGTPSKGEQWDGVAL